jgi:hypothetical protein
MPISAVSTGAASTASPVSTPSPTTARVSSRWAYRTPPSSSFSWALTSNGTTTEVSTPPSSSS